MKRNPKFKPDAHARLMEQVKEVLRYHHYYAHRTEQTYCDWILRYLKFHGGKTHPREMGKAEIERFVSHLAVQGNVAASTQQPAPPLDHSARGTTQRVPLLRERSTIGNLIWEEYAAEWCSVLCATTPSVSS